MVRQAVKCPLIVLGIIGSTHFAAEAIWDDLREVFVPSVVGPVLLVIGMWAGVNAARAGGGLGTVAMVGVLVGVLAAAFEVVFFGGMLDRGWDASRLDGLFAFLVIWWGALIGGGYELGRPDAGA